MKRSLPRPPRNQGLRCNGYELRASGSHWVRGVAERLKVQRQTQRPWPFVAFSRRRRASNFLTSTAEFLTLTSAGSMLVACSRERSGSGLTSVSRQ